MRKVVVTEFISVDGVIEEPGWSLPYWNDAIAQFKEEEQQACDALLLGRVTFDGFAAVWPGREGEDAEVMNALPKYVVSGTLREPGWNGTVITGDVYGRLAELKEQPGRDLLVYGSAELVRSLLPHGLVDEFRLLVYPVVLGQGRRLFGPESRARLALVRAEPMGNGVMGLVYEVEKEE